MNEDDMIDLLIDLSQEGLSHRAAALRLGVSHDEFVEVLHKEFGDYRWPLPES